MKKIWLLTKMMLSTSGLLNVGNKNKKGKEISKKQKTIRIVLLALLCFGSIGFTFGLASYTVTKVLVSVNLQDAVLKLGFPLMYLGTAIISLFPVISIFFLSNDNEILLPLPLKPSELIASRFLVTLFDAYIMVAMFMAPLLIGYGLGIHAGILYYVLALLNILILPLAPLGILLLLSVLVFQKVNTSKFKDLFTYIFVGIVLVVAFSFSTVMSTTMSTAETDPNKIIELIRPLVDGYITKLTPFMPSVYFSIKGLIATNIGGQLLFTLISILISVAIAVITIIISSPMYLRSIKGSNENSGKKRKVSKEKTYKNVNQNNQFFALVKNEWKLIIRNPTHVMNLVVPAFIFPVVFLLSFILQFSSNTGGDMQEFVNTIRSSNFNPSSPLGFLVFLGIVTFLSSMVMTSSTAISRMGKSASFIKYIPVSINKIINSKAILGVILSTFASLVMVIAITIIGVTTWLEALVLMITAIPLFLLINYIAIHIDSKKPHLDWINETQAVKQNTNTLLFMFGTWAVAIVIAGIGFAFFLVKIPNLGYAVAAVVTIICVILDIVYNKYLRKHAYTYFDNIK